MDGAAIDLSSWLSPIDGANPSGESLRDDERFHALERLTEPQVRLVRDERNNPSAQVVEPVDWGLVLDKAAELRPKGRDLRLLVLVARAHANEEGLAGLAAGLDLLAQSIAQHWDTMHPELRTGAPPLEGALRRTNALLQLQNGQDGTLGDLRARVLFTPRVNGPITGRDLERASLDGNAALNEAPGMSGAERTTFLAEHEKLRERVRVGCAEQLDQNAAELTDALDAGTAALAALAALDKALSDKLGTARSAAPDLRQFLERSTATLQRAISVRSGNGAAQAEAPEPAPVGGSAQPSAAPAPSTPAAFSGPAGLPDRLMSRDDVLKALDLVIAFYDRSEPSSPIPHLIRRVRRMVPMDFMALMEDLAPSGLKEFRLLAGVPDGKKPSGEKN